MKSLMNFITNPFLITAMSAWFISQISKIFTHWAVYKRFDYRRMFSDGGMPSSHTSMVTALTAYTAIARGLNSFEFALTAIITLIVCRDAVGVRLETGKQAMIINEWRHYFKDMESGKADKIKLKEFVGHTPLQMWMGALLGTTVGILLSFIL